MVDDNRSAEMREIWALFAQEARDNLSVAETALLQLEQDRTEADQVAALFRAIHSFKGGARMMGLSVVEALAHHAEDLIALVRDEGVALQNELIEALFAALDKSRTLLDQVLASGCDVEPSAAQSLIDTLQQLFTRYRPAPDEASPGVDRSDPIGYAAPDEVSAPMTNLIEPLPPESTAPLSVIDFLHGAERNLAQLHTALDVLASEPIEGLAQVHAVCGDLKRAAERLGFERVIGVVDDLASAAAFAADNGASSLDQLHQLEIDLFEELTRIEEAADHAAQPDRADRNDRAAEADQNDRTDIAWLFRHWHADRVFVDLAQLNDIADQLDQLAQHFTVEINAARQIEQLADEATARLRAICHSCIFYQIDPAVHVTLALEDLYARVAQTELVLNAALTNLTRDYCTQLGGAIEAIREGAVPPLEPLAALMDRMETVLYLQVDGPAHQAARAAFDALDLVPQFKEAMTPEAWAQLGQSLQAGEKFYTVLADLEHDEALGQAFFGWACSAGIHLITNITLQSSAGPLFDFLVATSRDHATLRADLVRIDPTGQHLTLRACGLREDTKPTRPLDRSSTNHDAAPIAESGSGASIAAPLLARLIETAGELAVHHATLQRVAGRLGETDFVEPIMRAMEAAHGDGAQARHTLKALLNDWLDDVHTLGQAERDLGTALDQLQESTRQLRLTPAADLLAPLQRLVHDLGRQLNKSVELTAHGTQFDIDRAALEIVAEPLRQLVWFGVVHSLETTERRQALGKAAQGRVTVTIDPHDDHLQVSVEDDGRGLDRELILQHLQELHWLDRPVSAIAEVDVNCIFRPGFGRVGGLEGVDLSALASQLQAQHGQISVTSERDRGSRFVIRLSLDMAVVDGMVVRAGHVRYVIPVNTIRRIVQPAVTDLVHSSADGAHTLLRTEGEIVQIRTLGCESDTGPSDNVMVIVNSEQGSVALAVDELIGRQQVMARPLQGHLSSVRNASGCALLGEGEVGMILNLGSVN